MKGLSKKTLSQITNGDVEGLLKAERSYGDSWKKRGGVGAFMMLARKWDRIENQVNEHGWNVLLAMKRDKRPEGLADDIKDLRRYLLLVEDFINTTGEQNDP